MIRHLNIISSNMSLNRRRIESAENRYKINQILLSSLNLWPFQQSKYTKIIRTFHFGIMTSFIFFQLTSFVTYEVTLDVIIMVLSYAIPSFIYVIQYYSFSFKPYTVKRIWKDIHNSWDLMKNGAERKIMRQYSIAVSIITSCVFYAIFEAMPIILDMIFPLNETRPREIHALTEYFIDERTYFCPILCHWLIGLMLGAYVVAVTCTLHLVYMEHICGLLKVANYRIEHSLDECALCDSTHGKNRAIQNITAAVDIHRKAVKRCVFVLDNFNPYFFVILIIGVSSLSLNLFRLLKTILALDKMVQLVSSILFVTMHFVIMYLANYYGQKITDHHNELFNTTYNVQWYTAPIKIQKLLLFVMQSTTKSYFLNIGKLVIISIEGFAQLISLSISYFTVIYSLL
ncbi:uncharacterized protein LOC105284032 isoform X2 [Ooceraea biroi]|uniref:uncharacterized protein LOC105284032 isoform X2 n=1 Tax=Ooceraea biroi TaxID=2015173 RepID=UPI000F0919D7|nr:uncharacterized protein LOC105284032 isoform X2 [Ooceraea biroi]